MNVLERIACNNFIEDNGCAYLSNCYYNGFFTVEIRTGKTVFLGMFDGEKPSEKNIHKEIFLRDNKIYVCPWKGRYVHIWNLRDQKMHSVEIRTKNDPLFFVDEVVLGENDIFFLPDLENAPVKRMNLGSSKVTELEMGFGMNGKNIAECKDIFPEPGLIEKWGIEYADRFYWRQASGEWYAFYPLGRHIMRYVEGKDKLEIIPLTIVNKEEFAKHLHTIRNELFSEDSVLEGEIGLQDFLDEMIAEDMWKYKYFQNKRNIGRKIWKQ